MVETSGGVPRHAGSKMLVYANGETRGTVGGGGVEAEVKKVALEAMNSNQTRIVHYSLDAQADAAVGVCGGTMTIYIEPQLIKPKLLIVGAGHVGKAVAKFGQLLNFHVIVSDDRTELCSAAEFPGIEDFLPVPLREIPDKLEIDQHTYIVLVTRGSDIDIVGLPRLLETDPAYIGLIGSRRRWDVTRKGLLAQGLSEDQLQRIKTPIGLDIQAETPDEIAVSILAEIIQYKNTLK